jgi:hypothetical protein
VHDLAIGTVTRMPSSIDTYHIADLLLKSCPFRVVENPSNLCTSLFCRIPTNEHNDRQYGHAACRTIDLKTTINLRVVLGRDMDHLDFDLSGAIDVPRGPWQLKRQARRQRGCEIDNRRLVLHVGWIELARIISLIGSIYSMRKFLQLVV